MQSFDDKELAFLGRAHSAKEAETALDMAQKLFARVSFDLIYALPDQSEQQWRDTLAYALAKGTDHLSLYQLTIEDGTRFASDVRKGQWTPMDDDPAAIFYELTQEICGAADMPAYETSNHARAGQESRHNLTYWRYLDYHGIGPGRMADVAASRRCAIASQKII